MAIEEQNLRLIFGLKLSQFRAEKGFSLKALAAKANMSVSYLNEIEKGKKYPKAEKVMALANALGKNYDDLVSLKLGQKLSPLADLLKTSILNEIPFEVFGVDQADVLQIMANAPTRFSALVDTIVKIARSYDMKVEHLLLGALRSYQEMHNNYFEDLEEAAETFLQQQGWSDKPISDELLDEYLRKNHNYEIDYDYLQQSRELSGMRSVFLPGDKPQLLINGKMLPAQRAFAMAREIGYEYLGLSNRVTTSTWVKVESFDQLLNNMKASYFAGALLLKRKSMIAELERFFAMPRWDGSVLTDMATKQQATPEMLFHRMTQLIGHHFGITQFYFLRFNHHTQTGQYKLTKELHFSRLHNPHSVGLSEHYCRRWITLNLLDQLSRKSDSDVKQPPLIGVQRSRFYQTESEYFNISLARPLMLTPGTNSCVTLGFLMNATFRKKAPFSEDESITTRTVNETCERCAITDCQERAAEPVLHNRELAQERREAALERLREEFGTKD